MHFSEFNLIPDLQKGIEEAGYAECTTVQHETLQHTLSGKDVFVQSQTGTGKTAAFLISIFELMARSTEQERAIIISPTRELAVQIAEEAKLLALYLDLNIITVFGGVGYMPQIKAIEAGPDLLIGTPGRIIDMSNKKMLNLRQFSLAVIDEADRMFDMGFVHDIQTILYRLPSQQTRQTMLFSATLSSSVKRLASGSMNQPAEVLIAPETITVDTINQRLYHVGSDRKIELLLGILKKYHVSRTLVFVNMKHVAEELAERLKGNGMNANFLTGDLPQRQRQQRIEMFKNNDLPILVATDVAARGIHVDDLELVVNYDIPMHNENYVHRIGRTARAGKSGHAIMLACETFVEFLAPIEEFIRMKIPSSVAEEELYCKDATAGKSFRRKRRSSEGGDRGGRSSSGPRRSSSGGSGSSYRSEGRRSGSNSGRSGGSRPRSGGSGSSERFSSSSSGNRRNEGGAYRSRRSSTESNNRNESSNRNRRPKNEQSDTGTTPNQMQESDNQNSQNSARRSRKTGVTGRIPASHVRDGRSFEKHQHTGEQQPQQKKAPEKKKGIFAKVMSIFK